MLYTYNIKKESIYHYSNIFCKKVNKPRHKTLIVNFSLLIFFTFCIVSYFSITPTFIFLYRKTNDLFLISLIICVGIIYMIVRNFLKTSNYTQVIVKGLVLNNFYKDGYIINIDDISKEIQIQNSYLKITLNILEDLDKNDVHIFKDFISITFNKNTVFLPKEDCVLYLFKNNNLI